MTPFIAPISVVRRAWLFRRRGGEIDGGWTSAARDDASGSTADLVILLRFESVLNGMAVKYTREAAAVGFFSETHHGSKSATIA